MGISVHRHGDTRVCGATTVSTATSVYVNGNLVALDNDPNSHGAGNLIAAVNGVYAEGKLIVGHPNEASADNLCPIPPHCEPDTNEGSTTVFVGA